MEQLQSEIPFARFVAEALTQGFVLIDVGVAYGIAPAWRCFGDKLRGYGFDPDAEEIARLNRIEPAPGFRYLAGHIGVPSDHPFAAKRRGTPRIERNPTKRLAVSRWLQIQRAREAGIAVPPNLPRPPPRGDDQGEAAGDYCGVINLPDFLPAEGIATVDCLKVDIDGADYDILQSMAGWYDKFTVLGIGVEVNYVGSDADTCNTFHNVDRFLRGEGFALFDLSVRRYPVQDLPGPSVSGFAYPALCAFGRPFQGDAFYARDICAPWEYAFAARLSDEGIAKAAALFAIFGLPDCAAEVLATFRERLEALLDVDRGLDLLAAQAQPGNASPLSYRDYIASFEKQSYEKGGVYVQDPPQPSAHSGSRARPLVQAAYDCARRRVYDDAACSGGTRLAIRTGANQWQNSVEFPLEAGGLDPEARLRVMLRVIVQHGSVGLGILSADRLSLPDEILIGECDGASLVELVTGRLADSGPLLVRNARLDGASELDMEILGVTALPPEGRPHETAQD